MYICRTANAIGKGLQTEENTSPNLDTTVAPRKWTGIPVSASNHVPYASPTVISNTKSVFSTNSVPLVGDAFQEQQR